jgi:ABC-type glycerol-3-phosphate transport system permease component
MFSAKSTKRLKGSDTVIFIFLLFAAICSLLPLLWALSTSLKSNQEIYRLPLTLVPDSVTLEHYGTVLQKMNNFVNYFWNSVIITALTLLFVLVFSALAGYGFGRIKFPGNNLLFSLVLLAMVLPFTTYIIPVYIMEVKLSLLNTRMGLVLPYVAMFLPLGIFIMRGAFLTMPSELEDAARIDGCNEWQLFYKIMLPIAKPALASTTIFTFISSWEEFMYALVLTPSQNTTLSVGITYLKEEGASWAYGPLCAVIVLGVLPVLTVFVMLQKYFIKGLTDGALKG